MKEACEGKHQIPNTNNQISSNYQFQNFFITFVRLGHLNLMIGFLHS
jgi:hypothetical protein